MAGKHRRVVQVHGDDTYERIWDLVRLGAVVSVEFVLRTTVRCSPRPRSSTTTGSPSTRPSSRSEGSARPLTRPRRPSPRWSRRCRRVSGEPGTCSGRWIGRVDLDDDALRRRVDRHRRGQARVAGEGADAAEVADDRGASDVGVEVEVGVEPVAVRLVARRRRRRPRSGRRRRRGCRGPGAGGTPRTRR